MIRSKPLATLLWASAAAMALVAGGVAAQDHGHDAGDTHYRLFIGDHAEGMIRAIEMEDGADAGTFSLDMTPAMTRSTSGRTIFAVQGDAGKVAVIDTGIALEDHGDHTDLSVTEARLLATEIAGTRPAHVVEGSGTVAIFDDGTGSVMLFPESAVLEGAFDPVVLEPGAAHHGLVPRFRAGGVGGTGDGKAQSLPATLPTGQPQPPLDAGPQKGQILDDAGEADIAGLRGQPQPFRADRCPGRAPVPPAEPFNRFAGHNVGAADEISNETGGGAVIDGLRVVDLAQAALVEQRHAV